MSSASTRTRLVEVLEKAWAGDVELLVALYAEDCTFEDKAFGIVHHGHAGIREVFAFSFAMMPDFRVSYGKDIIGATCGGQVHAGSPYYLIGRFAVTLAGILIWRSDARRI